MKTEAHLSWPMCDKRSNEGQRESAKGWTKASKPKTPAFRKLLALGHQAKPFLGLVCSSTILGTLLMAFSWWDEVCGGQSLWPQQLCFPALSQAYGVSFNPEEPNPSLWVLIPPLVPQWHSAGLLRAYREATKFLGLYLHEKWRKVAVSFPGLWLKFHGWIVECVGTKKYPFSSACRCSNG